MTSGSFSDDATAFAFAVGEDWSCGADSAAKR